MMHSSGPAATSNVGLSAERILAMAVAIADSEGLDAVSMRRLGREHSVSPMAMYSHFKDKDDLLDAMAEQVVGDAEFTDIPHAGWESRYRSVLSTLVELLGAHPWMGRLVIERVVPLPNYLAALEIMLDGVRQAGLTPQLGAMLVQQSVQTVVALAEYEPRRSDESAGATVERAAMAGILNNLAADAYPNVRAAAGPLTTPQNRDDYYRVGIDAIVGGIRVVANSNGATNMARLTGTTGKHGPNG